MNRGFLKVVGQSLIVRLASAGVLFALSILLARSLGPQGFGAYSFAFSIISLAVLIAQLGFPDLTIREVSKLIELKRHGLLGRYLQHGSWMIMVTSLLILAIVLLTMPLLGRANVSSWNVILAGFPLAVLWPLTAQSAAVLRGAGHVVQSQIGLNLYRPLLLLLLVGGFLLAKVPVTATAVMALHGLACLAVFIDLRLRNRRTLPELGAPAKVSRARLLAWSGTAVMFSGVAVVQLINTKFDTIAIGLLMTDSDVGLYTAAAQISQIAAVMLIVTAGIVQPAISRASIAGNDAEIEVLCRQSAMLSVGAALLTLVPTALFGEWFIGLAFGPEYVEVWPTLMVLVGGKVMNAFFGPVGLLLNMREKERTTLVVTFAAMLANVALNFALIPLFGLVGAAAATVAAMLIWNVILWIMACRLWGINCSASPWPCFRRAKA